MTRAIAASLRLGIGIVLLARPALHAQDAPPLTGPGTEKRFPPLRVPDGFTVTLFACDPLIEYPSVIARGERVGSLFVAYDYMTGLGTEIVRRDEIRRVEDTDGDGYADASRPFAEGLNSVMGLAFDGETVFAMHAPYLTSLRDTDGDGVADERRDLISGLGPPPEENAVRLHAANGVAIGHDGWLYLALGDHGCDVMRPEGDRLLHQGGGILRCRADGRDLHVFSTGLRNIYDVALDEELNVFVRDNENDGGDYMNRVYHSFFGAAHGYPYLYYERPEEALAPLADLGRGSSAGGVWYGETAFPAEYRGDLFFSEWGRAVVRYRRERASGTFRPMAEMEFAAGAENDPYGFKPTDLVVDHDGSLLVADWADGQRPKRGRGRIYRIRYGAPGATREPAAGSARGRSLEDLVRELDADSYLARAEAQRVVMERGPEGRAAILSRLHAGGLGDRGRIHAVWALAGWGGDDARGELFRLAVGDLDPGVRAGAVRALADLSDPVFLARRLDSGPGDTGVMQRLAKLLNDADARVRLEVIIALGRLRWAGAPERLRSASHPADPALAHAILGTLRRSGNWPAVLDLVDERPSGGVSSPLRDIALRALSGVFDPVVVDGLIERLADPSPSRRAAYADALTRAYRKPGSWVYWGYRPPPRPAGTEAWTRTAAIEAAFDRVLGDPDRAVRTSTLERMLREKVPARLATLSLWLEVERDVKSVGVILEALRDAPAVEARELLAGVVRDGTHASGPRQTALEMLTRSADEATTKRLSEITTVMVDDAVLAAVLRHLGERPELLSPSLLGGKLRSPDPEVRAVALELIAARGATGDGARVLEMLEDDDPRVRRAAASAVGRLGERRAIIPLLALGAGEDLALRRASLESLARLGDTRALPLALRALDNRETRRAALDVLAALGGPEHVERIVEVAGKDRSFETLLHVARLLTTWQEREAEPSPLHLALEQSIQRVQGTSGVLARWMTTGPLAPETASAVVAGLRSAGSPGDETIEWRRILGAGLACEVSLASSERSGGGGVWVAYCDISLDDPADVQFLGSSDGTLRVWAGDRLLHERAAAGAFRPDSDRFEATLDAGMHRIVLESRPAADVRFHLRFRRRSSTPERELLARLLLERDGSVEQGRDVFHDEEKAQCIRCHRLGAEGGSIGPDLTSVGSRFSRAYLIESILEPGRAIAPSFDTHVVALEGGEALAGVKVAETASTLTFAFAQGESRIVQKAHIVEQQIAPGSIMPEGLEKQLTERQLIDLVAFLLAQKD